MYIYIYIYIYIHMFYRQRWKIPWAKHRVWAHSVTFDHIYAGVGS